MDKSRHAARHEPPPPNRHKHKFLVWLCHRTPPHPKTGQQQPKKYRTVYFHSLRIDMFMSLSFFMTFATDISKSSWVTWMRRSRSANIPASVHTAYRERARQRMREVLRACCVARGRAYGEKGGQENS